MNTPQSLARDIFLFKKIELEENSPFEAFFDLEHVFYADFCTLDLNEKLVI